MTASINDGIGLEPGAQPPGGSWPAVLSIAAGTFFLVLTEFLPIGMMTPIAQGLGVSEGQAGLVVTSPGLMGAIAAPGLMLMVRGTDRRILLWLMTGLIIASNVIAALAPTLAILVAGRVLLGIGVGGLWTFAVPAARRLVPENAGGRATALVAAGISVGTVVGIPAGAIISDWLGWRAAFWMLALLGGGVLIAQVLALRPIPVLNRLGLRDLVALLHVPKARVGLIAIVLVTSGHFMAYTYLEPFLRIVPRLGQNALSWALLLYGLAGVAGTFLAERALAKGTRLAFSGAAILLALAVFATALCGSDVVAAFALIAMWGCAFGAIPVCIQIWMYQAAPAAFEGGSALFVGVFQIALAGGAFFGGLLVDARGLMTAFVTASVLAAGAAVFIAVFGRDSPTETIA